MDETAFVSLTEMCQLLYCRNIGKISFFVVRLAIIGDGQGRTVDDYIGMNSFEKVFHSRRVPYISFNEMIASGLVRSWKNIRVQGASGDVILFMSQQIIQ